MGIRRRKIIKGFDVQVFDESVMGWLNGECPSWHWFYSQFVQTGEPFGVEVQGEISLYKFVGGKAEMIT